MQFNYKSWKPSVPGSSIEGTFTKALTDAFNNVVYVINTAAGNMGASGKQLDTEMKMVSPDTYIRINFDGWAEGKTASRPYRYYSVETREVQWTNTTKQYKIPKFVEHNESKQVSVHDSPPVARKEGTEGVSKNLVQTLK